MHRAAGGLGEELAIALVERYSQPVAGRTDIRGPVPLAGGGRQGELRYREQPAVHIDDGTVQDAFLVIEDAQRSSLGCQPRGVLLRVAVFNADEYEQAAADAGDAFSLHGDRSFRYPLYYQSHMQYKNKDFFIILRPLKK